MTPTIGDSDDRRHLDAVLLGEDGGDNMYVFYPTDASSEELKTMWIRSPESESSSLPEQQ